MDKKAIMGFALTMFAVATGVIVGNLALKRLEAKKGE